MTCAHGSEAWIPLRCRHCIPCQETRRNQHTARILGGLIAGERSGFLTLTTTPATSWKTIMRAWQTYVRMLRKANPNLQYALAKEEGSATGMRHLHAVIYPWVYVPHAKLSAAWQARTGAWNVNIQAVSGTKTTSYVTKYLTKQMGDLRKRITYSRNWPKTPISKAWKVARPLQQAFEDSRFNARDSRGWLYSRGVQWCQCCPTEYETRRTLEQWPSSYHPPPLAFSQAP